MKKWKLINEVNTVHPHDWGSKFENQIARGVLIDLPFEKWSIAIARDLAIRRPCFHVPFQALDEEEAVEVVLVCWREKHVMRVSQPSSVVFPNFLIAIMPVHLL